MPHVNVTRVVAVLAIKEEHRRSDNGGAVGGSKKRARAKTNWAAERNGCEATTVTKRP